MGAEVKGQGHKVTLDENAVSNFCYISSELFPVIFLRFSAKLVWYIGSPLRINPVSFQVRTPKVNVTVR